MALKKLFHANHKQNHNFLNFPPTTQHQHNANAPRERKFREREIATFLGCSLSTTGANTRKMVACTRIGKRERRPSLGCTDGVCTVWRLPQTFRSSRADAHMQSACLSDTKATCCRMKLHSLGGLVVTTATMADAAQVRLRLVNLIDVHWRSSKRCARHGDLLSYCGCLSFRSVAK